jgi:hypothetical protein
MQKNRKMTGFFEELLQGTGFECKLLYTYKEKEKKAVIILEKKFFTLLTEHP